MKLGSRSLRLGLTVALLSVAAVTAAAERLRIDADAAVQMALAASQRVTAAGARIGAAQFTVDAADGARLPVVGVSAGVSQRSAVPEFAAPVGGPGTEPVVIFPNIESTYAASIGVKQPLYAGGGIEAGREAARHGLAAAASAQDLTLLGLRYEARVGYWWAVATDAALGAAQAQERRALRLLDDARALRGAGMAVDADVLGAEARSAAAQLDIVRRQTELSTRLADLRSLLGVAGDVELELADRGTRELPPMPAALDELLAAASQGRPELAIADARVAELLATGRAVNAARKPSLGLAAQWDVARPNSRYLPQEDVWNDSWSIGLLASWTLFDGERTLSDAAAVRAEAQALAADRDELARQVRLQVETARLSLAAALEAVGSADASRAAAAAREEASRERYAAGLAPIVEMLDAQAELSDAEVAQITVRATAWIAAAELERAIGR
jgi:outer membrane protein TolC